MFNPQDSNIHEFICRVNYMVEYLNHLPPFGQYQEFLEDGILELVELVILCEWHKQLLVQGFESEVKILNTLIELFGHLNTSKEIFNSRGDD